MKNPKITRAIAILKKHGITGKFRGALVSETNGNEVDFYMKDADGIYCTANVRSGAVKGI